MVLQVITNAACQHYYGTWTIILSSLCTGGTGGVGLCGGDAGGPLFIGSGNDRLLVSDRNTLTHTHSHTNIL